MATISNTIALEDKMSSTMNKIQQNAIKSIEKMNEMDKSIKAVEKALADAEKANPKIVDTEIYSQAVEGLEAMKGELYEVSQGQEEFTQNQEEMNSKMFNANQALQLLEKAWSAFNKVLQEANSWMEANNNQFNQEFLAATKLHNVLGANDNEITSMYDYASALQKVGVVGDEATLAGMQTLSMYTDTYDQLKQLVPYMDDLAVYLNGLDTSQSNVESTAALLGKALQGNAGMLKRYGIVTDAQAEALNKMNSTQERADALMKIFNGTIRGTNEILAQTSQGSIMQAKNNLGDLAETLGSSVTPYFDAFYNAIYELVAPAVQWLADNMNIIAPILIGIAAIIGILIAGFTIYAGVMMIAALAELAVCTPLLIIIGIIGGIIAVIYVVVNALNSWQGTTTSVVGVIMGLIYTLAAFIYNTFIVNLWNAIASFVNFFAHVWQSPVNAVKQLFYDLASDVIGQVINMAKVIEEVINKIPGVQVNITSGLQNFQSKVIAAAQEATDAGGFTDVMQNLDKWDYSDAYSKGYDVGSNISDKISEGFGEFDVSKYTQGFDGIQNGLDGIGNSLDGLTGVSGGGTKALKTTTDDDLISDDDIQLLLDVATRDYKIDYQQITPNITLTFGDIRETADVDVLLDQVATRLEEIYDGNLEVAY